MIEPVDIEALEKECRGNRLVTAKQVLAALAELKSLRAQAAAERLAEAAREALPHLLDCTSTKGELGAALAAYRSAQGKEAGK